MKIYNFSESRALEKMRKKRGEVLVENSQYLISKAKGILTKGMYLVELPLITQVFLCDCYTIRGDLVIATSLEDKERVTLINSKMGEINWAKRVEYSNDMMLATLIYGNGSTSRRFVDGSGKILDGEIGLGGFVQETGLKDSHFVDENGNTCTGDQTFLDYKGRVRCGINSDNNGIWRAINVAKGKPIAYNMLGQAYQPNMEDNQKWSTLYKFYKGELKLDKINEYYLLDNDFYNAVVDMLKEKFKKLSIEKYQSTNRDFVAESTASGSHANEIIDSLYETLGKLKKKRAKALDTYVSKEITKNSFNEVEV